ncbi:MAG: HupE/UreJ family protein [Candidatus Accumulibacter sp.]|jgi:urease accessory protein|nr:HupE/UreJ family protein [Accumulibacter sp.]
MKKHHLISLSLAVFPLVALAHTGHGGHGFMDGFAHPFLGLDHLLAMLLVGAWSVLHARRVWLAPGVFVALLAAGAVLGQYGFAAPQVEPLVAASVLALGLMLARPARLSPGVSLALIGGFALFHGMAHGGELEAGAAILSGIVLGSAALHLAGMGFAEIVLKSRPRLATLVGRIAAAAGGGLVLATVL